MAKLSSNIALSYNVVELTEKVIVSLNEIVKSFDTAPYADYVL